MKCQKAFPFLFNMVITNMQVSEIVNANWIIALEFLLRQHNCYSYLVLHFHHNRAPVLFFI